MSGIVSAWRWIFAALAAGTSFFLLRVPAEKWVPVGARIPAIVIRGAVALYVLSILGVLFRRPWGYAAALAAAFTTSAVASWTFFGYPKHSPEGAFIAAWIVCFTYQLLPGVRGQFFSEKK